MKRTVCFDRVSCHYAKNVRDLLSAPRRYFLNLPSRNLQYGCLAVASFPLIVPA